MLTVSVHPTWHCSSSLIPWLTRYYVNSINYTLYQYVTLPIILLIVFICTNKNKARWQETMRKNNKNSRSESNSMSVTKRLPRLVRLLRITDMSEKLPHDHGKPVNLGFWYKTAAQNAVIKKFCTSLEEFCISCLCTSLSITSPSS